MFHIHPSYISISFAQPILSVSLWFSSMLEGSGIFILCHNVIFINDYLAFRIYGQFVSCARVHAHGIYTFNVILLQTERPFDVEWKE